MTAGLLIAICWTATIVFSFWLGIKDGQASGSLKNTLERLERFRQFESISKDMMRDAGQAYLRNDARSVNQALTDGLLKINKIM
jgi:hypothetical protein